MSNNDTPQKKPARKKAPRRSVADWAPAFLATLRETGNVRLSCQTAGVERKNAYDWRDKDEGFRLAWAAAMEDAIDVLEAAARQRGLEQSDTLLIFLLKSHRREVYGDVAKVVNVNAPAPREAAVESLSDEELERIARRPAPKGRSRGAAAEEAGPERPA